MGKEAYDDYKRHLRDREANSQYYLVLEHPTSHSTAEDLSCKYTFGTLVFSTCWRYHTSWKEPKSTCRSRSIAHGTCFIHTNQLDGETDWKLRIAVPECQKLDEGDLVCLDSEIYGMSFFTNSTCKSWRTDLHLVQLMRLSRIFIRVLGHLPWIDQCLQASVPLIYYLRFLH